MSGAPRDGQTRRNKNGNTERLINGRWQAFTPDIDDGSQPRSNVPVTIRYEGGQQTRRPEQQLDDRASARSGTQTASRQGAQQSRQSYTNTTSAPTITQRPARRQSVSQPSVYASSRNSVNPTHTTVRNVPIMAKDARDLSTGVANRLVTGPPQALADRTDPQVLHDLKRTVDRSISSRNHPAQQINVNPKFKPDRQHDWFRQGRVFEIWYAEPANASTRGTSGAGSVSDPAVVQGNGGSYVYSKLRRFVVYRNGRMSCTALGIFSYGGQACGPPSRDPKDHGIVHILRQPPSPFRAELDEYGRSRLGYPPIRINADDPNETLKPSSRINYGKLYNIEHNLPVRNIGNVIELQQFINNVELEFGFGRQNAYSSRNNRMSGAPSSSAPRTRAENQQSQASISYSIPNAAQYSTAVNALNQGMSAVRLTSPSNAPDGVVRELAARIQQRKPEASWEQCLQQAVRAIAAARVRDGSNNDDDDDDDDDDEDDDDDDE